MKKILLQTWRNVAGEDAPEWSSTGETSVHETADAISSTLAIINFPSDVSLKAVAEVLLRTRRYRVKSPEDHLLTIVENPR